jgi:hypothetical protein
MYLDFRRYEKFQQIQELDGNSIEHDKLSSKYHEEEIFFAPTHKIEPFSDSYDMTIDASNDVSQMGWTDRIFWTEKKFRKISKEKPKY